MTAPTPATRIGVPSLPWEMGLVRLVTTRLLLMG